MSSPLSFWQEILLILIASLAVVYVAYFRIWLALAFGADALFLFATLLCVSTIALPDVWGNGAERLVDATSLPRALRSADRQVARIEAAPRALLDAILERLGLADDEAEQLRNDISLPPVAGERTPSTSEPPGRFTSTIRPSVDALVAMTLRTCAFLIGGLLLMISLAARSSTTTAKRLEMLSRRIAELESALEAHDFSTGGSTPSTPQRGTTRA